MEEYFESIQFYTKNIHFVNDMAQVFKNKSAQEGGLFLNDEILTRLGSSKASQLEQTIWVAYAIEMLERQSYGLRRKGGSLLLMSSIMRMNFNFLYGVQPE